MSEPSNRSEPRDGIAERLSRMIQVQSVSAEFATRGMQPFEEFIALLEELYPLVHKHLKRERITPLGLLFHWKGRVSTDPAVLMAHFDVVPVDENDAWSHPPFDGHVADGWVYGRGALDDKGPLVILLDAVENLLRDGFVPARDVYVSLGGNEETTGEAAREIAATFESRGIIPWLVIDEGGAVIDSPLPFAEGDFAMVGLGEKGIATIRLSSTTLGGHASTPPRLTAVSRVARAVTRLQPGMFSAKTPKTVTRMLSSFAEASPPAASGALRLLARSPRLTARAMLAMGGEMAASVRTTIAPTRLSGGTADNVLPSLASATINLRIALGESVTETVRRVRLQVNDPLVTVELVHGSEPTAESDSNNAQFSLIADAIEVSHPGTKTVPYVVMAATDSRFFHRFAPQVYRFAPLKMTKKQRESIHGVDERVEIAELTRGELFHRTLIQGL